MAAEPLPGGVPVGDAPQQLGEGLGPLAAVGLGHLACGGEGEGATVAMC